MKIYMVGGAVRDIARGKEPKDRDFVVVGASEAEFLKSFPTAKKVGKFFPVFLVNGHEYALARTERKTGSGHKGFEVECHKGITLAEDLLRRDLTINAMAYCEETDDLDGDIRAMDDIESKTLRHIGDSFADDPLRVFRVARFAATMEGFTVAEETVEVMKSMSGRLSELSAERVFGEMDRALAGVDARRFFEVLKDCGCLGYWFPELKDLVGVEAGPDKGKHSGEEDTFEHTMNVLSGVKEGSNVLRFAALCHDIGKALSPSPPAHHGHDKEGLRLILRFCNRLKVPVKYRKAALLFCAEHIRMHLIQEMKSGKAVRLLMDIKNHMPEGLNGFLKCSVGDGMTEKQADDILERAQHVFSESLPVKYFGMGEKCGDIMLQIRAEAWKRSGQ